MESIPNVLHQIGLTGFVDVGLMALLLYGLLVWLRRTRRAGLILGGILILGAIYLASITLGLILTSAVLKAFFAVFVITLVVIFQEELRHLFEQIAKWGLSQRVLRNKAAAPRLPRAEVAVLTHTLADLARERIGALVVITGSDSLARHVDGGVEVNGHLSEPLLKSVFDPHSMGHDGAVIIKGGVVLSLGALLPLSREPEALGPRGTRHAAALGLSERTDALCIVVSEERGTISVARHGHLQVMVEPEDLENSIEAFYEQMSPEEQTHPWRTFFLKNYREKVLALLISISLWFVVVYRTQEVINSTFHVSIERGVMPTGRTVRRMSPETILVELSGPRERLRTLQPGDLKLLMQMQDVSEGMQMIAITEDAFTLPDSVEMVDFNPRQVMVDIGVIAPPSTNVPPPTNETNGPR